MSKTMSSSHWCFCLLQWWSAAWFYKCLAMIEQNIVTRLNNFFTRWCGRVTWLPILQRVAMSVTNVHDSDFLISRLENFTYRIDFISYIVGTWCWITNKGWYSWVYGLEMNRICLWYDCVDLDPIQETYIGLLPMRVPHLTTKTKSSRNDDIYVLPFAGTLSGRSSRAAARGLEI